MSGMIVMGMNEMSLGMVGLSVTESGSAWSVRRVIMVVTMT